MNVGGSSSTPVIGVAGRRGFGKTTHLIQLVRNKPRVILYDSLNNDFQEGVVFRDWDKMTAFWRKTRRGNFRITYKPVDDRHFGDFCELAFLCGYCTVVITEMQLYITAGKCCPQLTKLITAGAHPRVELIADTQEPKQLGVRFRSQLTIFDSLNIREDEQRDYIERNFGFPSETLRTLPPWHYLHYEDRKDYYEICIDNPQTGETTRERISYGVSTAAANTSDAPEERHGDTLDRVDPK